MSYKVKSLNLKVLKIMGFTVFGTTEHDSAVN